MSVLKWAGGKALLLPELRPLLERAAADRYVDLFCGSLAVPLDMRPPVALYNDINHVLINMYAVIKDHLEDLMVVLDELNAPALNCAEQYNALRDEFNALKRGRYQDTIETRIRIAALMIYLNRRAFNGLYRENKSGCFNVPYRAYKAGIYDVEVLRNMHEFLNANDVVLTSNHYSDVEVQPGDLVFLDPPYYPTTTSKFTSYWKDGFDVDAQRDLCEYAKTLHARRIKFVMTNSPCQEVKDLYRDFAQKEVTIKRQMRSSKSGAGPSTDAPNELIVYNF